MNNTYTVLYTVYALGVVHKRAKSLVFVCVCRSTPGEVGEVLGKRVRRKRKMFMESEDEEEDNQEEEEVFEMSKM